MATLARTIAPAPRRVATARLAAIGTIAGALVALLTLAIAGIGPEGLRLAARYTARVSFPLFLVVYCTSPLHRLAAGPTTRWLLRERRGLGLAFAGAHFVHLAALVSFFAVSGETPPPTTVIFGGFGYLLIAAMAITSNDASVRRLGAQRWRRLHAVGLHYVWFIFILTHAMRVSRPQSGINAGLLAVGLGALAIRIAGRPQKPAPPPKRRPTARERARRAHA
jgi:DMSO/TMAO reductase YedYZ heme-binding membrane subunit